MAALLDLFNELEKMRRARASSSLSSIALIVGCYSMIHLSFTQVSSQWRAWPIELLEKKGASLTLSISPTVRTA